MQSPKDIGGPEGHFREAKGMRALGFVEMSNFTDALETLDLMLKSAPVQFVTWEKKLGGRLVTIIVTGETAAVKEAVQIAKNGRLAIAASAVIPNPHPETVRMVRQSAIKLGIYDTEKDEQ